MRTASPSLTWIDPHAYKGASPGVCPLAQEQGSSPRLFSEQHYEAEQSVVANRRAQGEEGPQGEGGPAGERPAGHRGAGGARRHDRPAGAADRHGGRLRRPAHSPIVAADPLNPQRLVAVYVTQDNTVDRRWNTIGLAYSTNAGQTWSLTSGSPRRGRQRRPRHDPSTYNVGNGQTTPFTTASTPSVCWDAQGNFYVVALQHNATYKSGQLVMSKFRFAGAATVPTAVFTNKVLQTWYDNEPIYNPVVAIDNNLPALRGNDSPSAVNVLDTMVNKAVYVGWNTRTKDGTTPTQGAFLDVDGPHGIRVMASSDGGQTFTTPVFVNDYTPNPLNPGSYDAGPTELILSAPQIIFTQGTHDGDLNSGEMLIAYSAGSGVRVSSSQPDEGKATNRVADAIAYAWSQANDPGNNSTIRDAATVTGSNPRFDNVTVTDFTIPVTPGMLPDKTFGSVVDLDLSLSLLHADVRQLQIELVFNQRDAGGVLTGLTRSIVLVENRLTNFNQDRGSWVGLPNAADRLGVLDIGSASAVPNQIGGPLYNNVDLIFDQQANLQINHAASSPSYVARFRPEGTGYDSNGTNSINSLIAGLSGADLTGDWVLRVTDHWDQDGNPAANPTNYGQGNRLLDFGLQFSSHIDMDHFGTEDVNTTAGTVANSPTNVYATHPTSPSNGIAPTVRFAQDTSVGGFSPYQGRIYMVYVSGNDIYLKASDDNGVNWDAIGGAAERVKVNDDSNLDEIMSTGGRAQFTPAIAVDPVTSSVVVTFYDGRYDASGTRVATYMAVSGDGGETFSPNVFLNEARRLRHDLARHGDHRAGAEQPGPGQHRHRRLRLADGPVRLRRQGHPRLGRQRQQRHRPRQQLGPGRLAAVHQRHQLHQRPADHPRRHGHRRPAVLRPQRPAQVQQHLCHRRHPPARLVRRAVRPADRRQQLRHRRRHADLPQPVHRLDQPGRGHPHSSHRGGG